MALQSSARAVGAESSPAGSPVLLSGLGNRFVELFGRNLSRQAFAEEVTRLVAEVVRLKAVVILGYDRRRERLVLLADRGLDDDARAALGAGGDCAWDIPMRGLRNRRISVIEAAHQNPFVPRPLIQLGPKGLCIASVPIYYDYEPAGVVLLLAPNSRTFPDTVLQTLSQALRACARGLRDAAAPALRPRSTFPVEGADGAELLDRSVAGEGAVQARGDGDAAAQPHVVELPAAQEPSVDAGRVQRFEDELALAREDAERAGQLLRSLTASSNAVARERDQLAQQLADAERQRDVDTTELRAQVAALEDRILATESDRSRYQRAAAARDEGARRTIATLESERTTLLQRVQSAESTAGASQVALTTVRGERERLVAQVETLTSQLRTTQETIERTQARYAEERTAIEGDRSAWKDEAASVRTDLAQRTESLLALERDLRSAVVARDAATTQLQAAREELSRLAALTEELGRAATQLESTRAAALAESATLRRTLEDERASRARAEETLQADLLAAQAQGEQLAADLTALRGELTVRVRALGERDEQLAIQRREQETAEQAHTHLQQVAAALRGDVATLSARLEQGAAERQQLLEERAALRAELAGTRQNASQTDVAHAAAFGRLQAEAAELRRQLEALTGERTGLSERHQHAVEEGRTLTRAVADAERRIDDLNAALQQRAAALETAATERARHVAQLATLTGQLEAAQEAFARAQAHYAQERTALETDRDGWKEQTAALRAELLLRNDSLAARERDLQGASVTRDALAADLQAAREEIDRLSAFTEDLRHTATQVEAVRDAALADSATLRRALDDERAGRGEAEQILRANLAAVQTHAEQLTATTALLRGELAERTRAVEERDGRLAALRAEIDMLRDQSVDRGVLAQQASELGSRVVDLEQQLAAVRGEAARAERQRAALAESLDAARCRETETAAAAGREHATLQESVERITQERSRLETERAAHRAEIDGLRATLADLQATLEDLRTQRTAAETRGQDVARQLADTQRHVAELSETLRQRDAALDSATAERTRVAAQVESLRAEARQGHDALEAAQRRFAQEQTAVAADRDAWQQQSATVRAERDQLAARSRDLEQQTAQLEAARRTALSDYAALQRALDDERTSHHQTTQSLQADLATLQSEAERLGAETTTLRGELAEHEAQFATLRQAEATARQSATEWEHATATLRAEVATLIARLDERTAECKQLHEGQASVERQLALVVATHGEEEQALAQGLQAAREQVAQLEEDRRALRAALSEARQHVGQGDAAHAAALAEARADAAELRKQVKVLTAARTKLTERLERAEEARTAASAKVKEETRRATMLAKQGTQLEQSLAAAHAQAQVQRAEAEAAWAEARREAQTLSLQLQASGAENQQLRDAQAAMERQVARLQASQGDEQQALQAARAQADGLDQARSALESALSDMRRQAVEAAAQLEHERAGTATLREHVQTLTANAAQVTERLQYAEQARAVYTERAEQQERRADALTEQCARLQQSLAGADQHRTAVENDLLRARSEIDALRQQSADRGVLAHQAAELDGKVVELEQQLAALRGAAARAERERAVVVEELEGARRQQADALAAIEHEKASLRETVERLSEERSRIEAENAAQAGQMEAQRVTLAELQATLEQVRAERAHAEEDGQSVTQRLAEAHRHLEELSARLRQRDANVETATAERQRLTAQVAKLTSQLRASQEALESTQGRDALERATAEAERDEWKAKAAAARAEVASATALTEQLSQATAQLEAARTAAVTENATLRRALEDEHANRLHMEHSLRADLAAARTEAERLADASVVLDATLHERDEQFATLREQHEAARQAEVAWQETTAALRAEIAAVTRQLDARATECQRLQDERETVERQLALVGATRGEEAEALTHGLEAARQQIAQLEQERAAMRDALAETRQRLGEVDAARAATVGTLQADATELRKQLKTVSAARAALTERLECAARSQAEHAERIETEERRAAALSEQCGQLERSLVAAEARGATLGGELAQVRAEIEALREQSADRGAQAHQASELRGKVVELERQLAELRGAGGRAERERGALAEELEALRRQHQDALAAAAHQQAALQESLQRATEERSRLEADRVAQHADVQAQQATVARLRAALEGAQAERTAADDEQHKLLQRVSESQRRCEELSEQLRQREKAIEAAQGERQLLKDALRAADLATEREVLRRAAPQRRTRGPQDAEAGSAPEADDTPAVRQQGPLVIERSAPLGAVVEATEEPPDAMVLEPEPAGTVVPTGELVLLDEGAMRDNACAALKGAGFEVTSFAPNEIGVDEVARRKVKCVMLNLGGGPAAWRTLRVLRERVGTRGIPILAYLMTPNAQTGFCFGRADFALWPMDANRLVERLGVLRQKLRRLLVLTADVDGMGRMRDSLAAAKISTSIVLDGKQALEFASMVDPEAAVLHLSPGCPTGPRALLGLRASDATRDLPILVLLDKTPAPREEAFFTSTALQLLGKTPFQFTSLPEEITRLIG